MQNYERPVQFLDFNPSLGSHCSIDSSTIDMIKQHERKFNSFLERVHPKDFRLCER